VWPSLDFQLVKGQALPFLLLQYAIPLVVFFSKILKISWFNSLVMELLLQVNANLVPVPLLEKTSAMVIELDIASVF